MGIDSGRFAVFLGVIEIRGNIVFNDAVRTDLYDGSDSILQADGA